MRGRDGYTFDGYRIRVEFPRSSSKGENNGRSNSFRGPPRGGFNRAGHGYSLQVTGLPPTGSWQDLKDHFRQAGDVVYTDVYKDGTGTVEFSRADHMKRALRDLDDSKFRSHEVRPWPWTGVWHGMYVCTWLAGWRVCPVCTCGRQDHVCVCVADGPVCLCMCTVGEVFAVPLVSASART